MEMENEDKRQKQKAIEETYRITVSKAAEKAIGELVERVNQDFEAGQVNRSQAASWILVRFNENLSGEEIKAIRMDHVDELALLEHYYRKAKETGQVQPEVRDIIRKLAGIEDTQRKPSKSRLTKTIINDDIAKDEGLGA